MTSNLSLKKKELKYKCRLVNLISVQSPVIISEKLNMHIVKNLV
jgi:hypothetical protein